MCEALGPSLQSTILANHHLGLLYKTVLLVLVGNLWIDRCLKLVVHQ
jgi:hypothetical protein